MGNAVQPPRPNDAVRESHNPDGAWRKVLTSPRDAAALIFAQPEHWSNHALLSSAMQAARSPGGSDKNRRHAANSASGTSGDIQFGTIALPDLAMPAEKRSELRSKMASVRRITSAGLVETRRSMQHLASRSLFAELCACTTAQPPFLREMQSRMGVLLALLPTTMLDTAMPKSSPGSRSAVPPPPYIATNHLALRLFVTLLENMELMDKDAESDAGPSASASGLADVVVRRGLDAVLGTLAAFPPLHLFHDWAGAPPDEDEETCHNDGQDVGSSRGAGEHDASRGGDRDGKGNEEDEDEDDDTAPAPPAPLVRVSSATSASQGVLPLVKSSARASSCKDDPKKSSPRKARRRGMYAASNAIPRRAGAGDDGDDDNYYWCSQRLQDGGDNRTWWQAALETPAVVSAVVVRWPSRAVLASLPERVLLATSTDGGKSFTTAARVYPAANRSGRRETHIAVHESVAERAGKHRAPAVVTHIQLRLLDPKHCTTKYMYHGIASVMVKGPLLPMGDPNLRLSAADLTVAARPPSARAVLKQLECWLVRTMRAARGGRAPAVHTRALASLQQLALATGSFAAVLRLVNVLLEDGESAESEAPVSDMQLPPETHACSTSFLQSLSNFARQGKSPVSTAPTPLTSPIQSPSRAKSDAESSACAGDDAQAPQHDVPANAGFRFTFESAVRSPRGLATALLLVLGRMVRNPPAPPPRNDTVDTELGTELIDRPFCVESSAETLNLLHTLLHRAVGDTSGSDLRMLSPIKAVENMDMLADMPPCDNVTEASLALLRQNLAAFHNSVLEGTQGNGGAPSSGRRHASLTQLRGLLEQMLTPDGVLRSASAVSPSSGAPTTIDAIQPLPAVLHSTSVEVAAVINDGLEVLYPSAQERLDLLLVLVRARRTWRARQQRVPSTTSTTDGGAAWLLLDRLLRRSYVPHDGGTLLEALLFCNSDEDGTEDGPSSCCLALEEMFNFAFEEAEHEVKARASDSTNFGAESSVIVAPRLQLADAALQCLQVAQQRVMEHALVSGALTAGDAAANVSAPPPQAASLLRWCDALLAHCCRVVHETSDAVMSAGSEVGEGMESAWAQCAAARRALTRSAVHTLLPPLLTALALGSPRLWLANHLVEAVVSLTAALDTASVRLCNLSKLERSLRLAQLREQRVLARTGCASNARRTTKLRFSNHPERRSEHIVVEGPGSSVATSRIPEAGTYASVVMRPAEWPSSSLIMANGRHEWSVILQESAYPHGTDGEEYGMGLGVATGRWPSPQNNMEDRFPGMDTNSWGFEVTGTFFHGNDGRRYGERCKSGDTIGVVVDFDEIGTRGAGTLRFLRNGVDMGEAWSGLRGQSLQRVAWLVAPSESIIAGECSHVSSENAGRADDAADDIYADPEAHLEHDLGPVHSPCICCGNGAPLESNGATPACVVPELSFANNLAHDVLEVKPTPGADNTFSIKVVLPKARLKHKNKTRNPSTSPSMSLGNREGHGGRSRSGRDQLTRLVESLASADSSTHAEVTEMLDGLAQASDIMDASDVMDALRGAASDNTATRSEGAGESKGDDDDDDNISGVGDNDNAGAANDSASVIARLLRRLPVGSEFSTFDESAEMYEQPYRDHVVYDEDDEEEEGEDRDGDEDDNVVGIRAEDEDEDEDGQDEDEDEDEGEDEDEDDEDDDVDEGEDEDISAVRLMREAEQTEAEQVRLDLREELANMRRSMERIAAEEDEKEDEDEDEGDDQEHEDQDQDDETGASPAAFAFAAVGIQSQDMSEMLNLSEPVEQNAEEGRNRAEDQEREAGDEVGRQGPAGEREVALASSEAENGALPTDTRSSDDVAESERKLQKDAARTATAVKEGFCMAMSEFALECSPDCVDEHAWEVIIDELDPNVDLRIGVARTSAQHTLHRPLGSAGRSWAWCGGTRFAADGKVHDIAFCGAQTVSALATPTADVGIGTPQAAETKATDAAAETRGEKRKGHGGTAASAAIAATEFQEGDIIGVRLSLAQRTLSFSRNGTDIVRAFSFDSSGDLATLGWCPHLAHGLHPAISVQRNKRVSLRVRPVASVLGPSSTLQLPWLFDLTKTAASLSGRFSATLVAGPSVSREEEELEPWLDSSLLAGGLRMSDGDTGVFLDSVAGDVNGAGSAILTWMAQQSPPPMELRLRRFQFPRSEHAFLAALLKHSNLPSQRGQNTAFTVARMIVGADSHLKMSPGDQQILLQLWPSLLDLRRWLLRKKQAFATMCDDESEDSKTSASVNSQGQEGTGADESKDDDPSEWQESKDADTADDDTTARPTPNLQSDDLDGEWLLPEPTWIRDHAQYRSDANGPGHEATNVLLPTIPKPWIAPATSASNGHWLAFDFGRTIKVSGIRLWLRAPEGDADAVVDQLTVHVECAQDIIGPWSCAHTQTVRPEHLDGPQLLRLPSSKTQPTNFLRIRFTLCDDENACCSLVVVGVSFKGLVMDERVSAGLSAATAVAVAAGASQMLQPSKQVQTIAELEDKVVVFANFLRDLAPTTAPALPQGLMEADSNACDSTCSTSDDADEVYDASSNSTAMGVIKHFPEHGSGLDDAGFRSTVALLRAQHQWMAAHAVKPSANKGLCESDVKTAETGALLVCKACLLYVTEGDSAPPATLRGLMQLRERRAFFRNKGFCSLLSLLQNTSVTSVKHDALIFLRPALRGVASAHSPPLRRRFAHGTRGVGADLDHAHLCATENAVDDMTLTPGPRSDVRFGQHHPLCRLGACSSAARASVQASFESLFMQLVQQLEQAVDALEGHIHNEAMVKSSACDAQLLIWTLAIDFTPDQYHLLLPQAHLRQMSSTNSSFGAESNFTTSAHSSGLVCLLHRLQSLEAVAGRAASSLNTDEYAHGHFFSAWSDDGTSQIDETADDTALPHAPPQFQLWSAAQVQQSLIRGTLSKWRVILHMRRYVLASQNPRNWRRWWHERGMLGPARDVAHRMSVDAVSHCYKAFVNCTAQLAERAAPNTTKLELPKMTPAAQSKPNAEHGASQETEAPETLDDVQAQAVQNIQRILRGALARSIGTTSQRQGRPRLQASGASATATVDPFNLWYSELCAGSVTRLRRTALLMYRFIASLAVGGEAARRKHEAADAIETATAAAKLAVDRHMRVRTHESAGDDGAVRMRVRAAMVRASVKEATAAVQRVRRVASYNAATATRPTMQLQQLMGQMLARELAIGVATLQKAASERCATGIAEEGVALGHETDNGTSPSCDGTADVIANASNSERSAPESPPPPPPVPLRRLASAPAIRQCAEGEQPGTKHAPDSYMTQMPTASVAEAASRLEVVEAEAAVFSHVLYLTALSSTPAGSAHITAPPVLRSLLILLTPGVASPRLQRLTLRLLRLVCSAAGAQLEPALLHEAASEVGRIVSQSGIVDSTSRTEKVENTFVAMLLNIIGDATCSSVNAMEKVHVENAQVHCSETNDAEPAPADESVADDAAPPTEAEAPPMPAQQPPNEDMVAQVTMQGVSLVRAQRAVFATRNAGVDEAVMWVFEHLDDPDIDTPLSPEELGHGAGSAGSSGAVGSAANEAAASAGPQPWICPVCTLQNGAQTNTCVVCGEGQNPYLEQQRQQEAAEAQTMLEQAEMQHDNVSGVTNHASVSEAELSAVELSHEAARDDDGYSSRRANVGRGRIMCTAADEAVLLMRVLLSKAGREWHRVILDSVTAAVCSAASHATNCDPSASDDVLCTVEADVPEERYGAAALAVVGAHNTALRIGSRVVVDADGNSSLQAAVDAYGSGAGLATLVQLEAESATASVAFEPQGPLYKVKLDSLQVGDVGPVAVVRQSNVTDDDQVYQAEAMRKLLEAVRELATCSPPHDDCEMAHGDPSGTERGGSISCSRAPPASHTSMMLSQLRSMALRALRPLIEQERRAQHASAMVANTRSKYALALSKLYDIGLRVVPLPSFVEFAALERKLDALRCRLLDAGLGVEALVALGLDANRPQKIESKEDIERRKSEARRRAVAQQLLDSNMLDSIPGISLEKCVTALEINGDSRDNAINWLFEKMSDTLFEQPDTVAEENKDPRNAMARELRNITQMPTKLCHHALEIFNDQNRAVAWLTSSVARMYMQHMERDEMEEQHVETPFCASMLHEPIGLASGELPDSHCTDNASARVGSGAPCCARLHSGRDASASGTGGWVAETHDANQYLQFDLGGIRTLTAIATQGVRDDTIGDMWVKSYKLELSDDGENWRGYIGDTGVGGDITANKDAAPSVYTFVMASQPVSRRQARYVRLRPTAWEGGVAMRVELYCTPLGQSVLSNFVAPSHFAASSQLGDAQRAQYVRGQTNTSFWKAAAHDENPWVSVDLGGVRKVNAIMTARRHDTGFDAFFGVECSVDGTEWVSVRPLEVDRSSDDIGSAARTVASNATSPAPTGVTTGSGSATVASHDAMSPLEAGDHRVDEEVGADSDDLDDDLRAALALSMQSEGGDSAEALDPLAAAIAMSMANNSATGPTVSEPQDSVLAPASGDVSTSNCTPGTSESKVGAVETSDNPSSGEADASAIERGRCSDTTSDFRMQGRATKLFVHSFDRAFDARYVRVLPRKQRAALELSDDVGSEWSPLCFDVLGDVVGEPIVASLPNSCFAASSELDTQHGATCMRLGTNAAADDASLAWCPRDAGTDPEPCIVVDLRAAHVIHAITTQGGGACGGWCTQYRLQTSADGESWVNVVPPRHSAIVSAGVDDSTGLLFRGNTDAVSLTTHVLSHEVIATHVRIVAMGHHGSHVALRAEIHARQLGGALGMANGAIADHQMTSSVSEGTVVSTAGEDGNASKCRLHNRAGAGAWIPSSCSRPWMQIQLRGKSLITGVATQGQATDAERPCAERHAWVTRYMLKTSEDGQNWVSTTFTGNVDGDSVVMHAVRPSIARFVRFVPLEHVGTVALRAELFGTCIEEPLGMQDKRIKDRQLTASSHRAQSGPKMARLHSRRGARGWVAARNDENQHLTIDLRARKQLVAIASQGVQSPSSHEAYWVQSYTLQTSDRADPRDDDWITYAENGQPRVFNASIPAHLRSSQRADHVCSQLLARPVLCRFVRIRPCTWHNRIAMRVELFGAAVEAKGAVDDTAALEDTEQSEPLVMEESSAAAQQRQAQQGTRGAAEIASEERATRGAPEATLGELSRVNDVHTWQWREDSSLQNQWREYDEGTCNTLEAAFSRQQSECRINITDNRRPHHGAQRYTVRFDYTPSGSHRQISVRGFERPVQRVHKPNRAPELISGAVARRGMVLTVNASVDNGRLVGLSGIVVASSGGDSGDRDRVRVRLLSEEVGLTYSIEASRRDLMCHTELFGEAVRDMADVRGMVCVTADALAVHAARRALVATLCSTLAATPELVSEGTAGVADADVLHKFGGAKRLVELLKLLVASERVLKGNNDNEDSIPANVPGVDAGDDNGSEAAESKSGENNSDRSDLSHATIAQTDPQVQTRSKIDAAAAATESDGSLVPALCGLIKQLLKVEAVRGNHTGDDNDGKPMKLSTVLVDDCAQNLVQATQPPASNECKVVESIHPYYPHCDYSGKVRFPGATALRVTFDPRCRTAEGDGQLFLAAHNGDEKETAADIWRSPLAAFSGEPSAFKPILVHGDTLHYRFYSNGSRDQGVDGLPTLGWGFRFEAVPLRGLQWLHEGEVLTQPSLEWACWVLNFLLEQAPELVATGVVHSCHVFDALVLYLRSRGVPYKGKVITLLAKLLQRPDLFMRGPEGRSSAPPDLLQLRGLSSIVMEQCDTMAEDDSLFLPARMQALVELMMVVRSAERKLQGATHASAGTVVGGGDSSDSVLVRGNGGGRGIANGMTLVLPPKDAQITTQEALADVMDIMGSLQHGTPLPPAVACQSWIEAEGLTETIESAHPLDPNDGGSEGRLANPFYWSTKKGASCEFDHVVHMPDAEQLCIRLDTRCCLPPGHRLVIEHVTEDSNGDTTDIMTTTAAADPKGAATSPAILAGDLAASLTQLGASPTESTAAVVADAAQEAAPSVESQSQNESESKETEAGASGASVTSAEDLRSAGVQVHTQRLLAEGSCISLLHAAPAPADGPPPLFPELRAMSVRNHGDPSCTLTSVACTQIGRAAIAPEHYFTLLAPPIALARRLASAATAAFRAVAEEALPPVLLHRPAPQRTVGADSIFALRLPSVHGAGAASRGASHTVLSVDTASEGFSRLRALEDVTEHEAGGGETRPRSQYFVLLPHGDGMHVFTLEGHMLQLVRLAEPSDDGHLFEYIAAPLTTESAPQQARGLFEVVFEGTPIQGDRVPSSRVVVGSVASCCGRALGLESGDLPDDHISASDYDQRISSYGPAAARLNRAMRPRERRAALRSASDGHLLQPTGWRTARPLGQLTPTALAAEPPHWLQVDLGDEVEITGIATQGIQGGLCDMRGGEMPSLLTTAYTLSMSLDGRTWRTLQHSRPGLEADTPGPLLFSANAGDATGNAIATHVLSGAVAGDSLRTRFVRLHPVACAHGPVSPASQSLGGAARPALRLELYARHRYVLRSELDTAAPTPALATAPAASAAAPEPARGDAEADLTASPTNANAEAVESAQSSISETVGQAEASMETEELTSGGTASQSAVDAAPARLKATWLQKPLLLPSNRVRIRLEVDAEAAAKECASDASSGAWGFALTVTAVGMSKAAQQRLLHREAKHVHRAARDTLQWTARADEQLVAWANARAEMLVADRGGSPAADADADGAGWLRIDPRDVQHHLRKDDCLRLQLLANHEPHSRAYRFAMIKLLNRRLHRVLPLLDVGSTEQWRVGRRLRKLGHCIFSELKQRLLEDALERTAPRRPETASLTLDHAAKLHSQDRGDTAPATSKCLFVQAFTQLRSASASTYRQRATERSQAFHVRFKNERGIDAGGVYREALTEIVDDLHSEYFSLLMLCPNGQHAYPTNANKYVPHPASTTAMAVEMFEFTGKIMGLSLRTRAAMPFQLPSIVWRALLGQPVDRSDLAAIDTICVQNLERIEAACDGKITSQEQFEAEVGELKFCAPGSDGKPIELKPGGAGIAVTMANRREYVALVETRRLAEFEVQTAAIQRGLATVVPMSILQLFTWQELEALVAGKPGVDIEYLKKHTDYRGFDPSSDVIRWFWAAMESFSPEDRTMFIRFVWGRNRLPPPGQPWPQRFTIDRGPVGDTQLPEAHTCFFSIDLPMYSNERTMRDRLLTAIHFGVGGILNG